MQLVGALMSVALLGGLMSPQAVTAQTPSPADAYRDAVQADSPVSYWRLSDSGSTALDTMGRNHGTYNGDPGQGASGILAGDAAVDFDGIDDFVHLGLPPSLQVNPWTLEAWVKPDSVAIATHSVYRWRWYAHTLKVKNGSAYANSYDSDGDLHSTADSKPLLDFGWHHLVVTSDGSTLRLYVDGVEADSTPAGPTHYVGGGAVAIGRDGDFDGEYFRGLIDEVAVYGHALSPARIAAHHDLGATAPATVDTEDMSPCTASVWSDTLFDVRRSDFSEPGVSACLILHWPVEQRIRVTFDRQIGA